LQEVTEKGKFSDYRTFGLSALRTIGPSDYRAVTQQNTDHQGSCLE